MAQSTVTVIGPVTAGDCAAFNSTTIIKDAGITCSGGGIGSPGGPNGAIQYNNSGSFGGFVASGDATVNTSTGVVTVTKTNGSFFGVFATASAAAATADLNLFSATLQGLVPASGGGANTFLRADGTFASVSNNLSNQTLPYTITSANTPCGSTVNIVASTSGTLTLSGVSGFYSSCIIQVCNTAPNNLSTQHAITLSGFPNPSLPHLWMQQCEEVSIISGAWQVTKWPGKFVPGSGVFCYADTGGSNSNDGLVSSASTNAVKDPQQCINMWAQEFDFNSGAQPTILLTNGQTNQQSGGAGPLLLVGGVPKVVSVIGNGGNATLQNTGGNFVAQFQDFGGYFIFQNVTLDCNSALSHPCYSLFGHQQGGTDLNSGTVLKGANAADLGVYCDSICKINGNALITLAGTMFNGFQGSLGSMFNFSNGIATAAGTAIGSDIFIMSGTSSLTYSGPITFGTGNTISEIFGARSGSSICIAMGTVTGAGGVTPRQWSILGNSVFSNLTGTAVPGSAGINTLAGFAPGLIGAAINGGC